MSLRGAALPPFERVIDEHGPSVLRFCVARAGAHSGEDVFQETMIAALRAYPELRDPGAVRGWLFSIAHRKTIDAARAGQRTPRPGGAAEDVEVRVAEAPADPDDDGLWRHVRALPTKQREAVTLRYLADLTYDEIGGVMATSAEAARRNVFEALRRLRGTVDAPDAGVESG